MTNEFKERRQKNAKVNLSPEDYAVQKKAEKEAVYKMIDDTALEVVADEVKFKSFLDLQSRMNRYTTANTLLMYKQFPNASQIKDFNSWAEKEVKINKGEKAFSILDPYEYTHPDGCIAVGYNVKKVFDISQTDAKTRKTKTADYDINTLIAALIDTSPISIEVSDIPLQYGDAKWYYDNKQTIFIKRDCHDSSELFCILAEATASTCILETQNNINVDFKSESIVYMLCQKYNIVDNTHIIVPKELTEQGPKTIRSELSDIREVFNEIHDRVSSEIYRKSNERQKSDERSR